MNVVVKSILTALTFAAACSHAAATATGPSQQARQGVLRTELTSQPDVGVGVRADGTQISLLETEASSSDLLHTMQMDTAIKAVAFSPNNHEVASGSAQNAVTVWSAGTGVALRNLYHHTGKVHSLQYSPDGEMLLSGGEDGHAIIWAAEKNEIEEDYQMLGSINSVQFSRDCMYIITGSDNKVSKIWDTRNKHLKCKLIGHTDKIEAVAMNPEGHSALTGSDDFTAKIWDIEECIGSKLVDIKEPEVTLSGHTGPVTAVAYSPYGLWVVTGSEDFTARIWLHNGTSLHIFGVKGGGHMGTVNAIAWKPRPHGAGIGWAPEQDMVLTGGEDGYAKIWYAHTGDLFKSFNHGGQVTSVAWGPNGDKILTGSTDGTAKIWNVHNTAMGTLMRGYEIMPSR